MYLLSPVQEAGMCLFLKFNLFFIIGKIGFGRRNETQIKRKHMPRKCDLSKIWAGKWNLYTPCLPPYKKPSLKTIVQRQQTKREFNYEQVFLSISRCWVVSTLEKRRNTWELACNSLKHFHVRINSGWCIFLERFVFLWHDWLPN